jgi:hypothetical protein
VRAGTTAVATVIVAIALVGGAIVLLTVLRGTLVDEVKDAAGAQASPNTAAPRRPTGTFVSAFPGSPSGCDSRQGEAI